MAFTNSSRLRSSYGLLRLIPNQSDYEYTPNVAYLPATGGTVAVARVKHLLVDVLLTLLTTSESLYQFLYSLTIRLSPARSVSQSISSFATIAKREDLIDLVPSNPTPNPNPVTASVEMRMCIRLNSGACADLKRVG